MISSQFAFPSSSTYVGGSSQTDLASSQGSGAQDSGANNSSANSQSFSHVFASHWASSSEDDQNNSHSAAVKRSQQDQDDDDQQNDDASKAAAAQQQNSTQPARPILPNLSALLGLPHAQQAPEAESSDAQSGATETPSTDGAQTSALSAGAGAAALKKGFSQALAAANLPGLAKSIKPENAKTTQSRDGNTLSRNALGLPVGWQQLAADSQGTNTPDDDAELEAAHAGGATSAAGNAVGEASNGVVAGAAGSPNAPIAFEMILNPDGASNGADGSEELMAPTQVAAVAAQLQNAFSGVTSGTDNPAATTLTGGHEVAAESNPLAAPATVEASTNSEERASAAGEPAPVKSTEADPAEGAAGREAVKNMRLQIEGENNQRIDVRLTDQGGALKVSVRSADPNVTRALQDHMPELTNRLQQQHFRTEVWMPRSSESSDSGSSNARQFHSQGDTSGQDQSGRRQNGRQNNQPDWLEENLPSQAGTKGRTDQI